MADTVLVVDRDGARRSALASPLRADGHDVVELRDETALLGHLLGSALETSHRPEHVAIVAEAGSAIVDVLRMLRCACWDPVIVLVGDASANEAARELGASTITAAPLDTPGLRSAVGRPDLPSPRA